MLSIAIYLTLTLLYGAVSARLARTVLTAPLLFAGVGLLAFALVPPVRTHLPSAEIFLTVAEVGLVLLLFSDASRTDLGILRNLRSLPIRLLSTGMLLTILLGGLAALGVFPNISLWEAGILAAILAPTDAGLGQIIVSSPRVPMSVRQALNVEAGLNDGLSVPFLLFFMALAGASEAGQASGLVRLMLEQLGGGAAVGIAIGLLGGFLLNAARRARWMESSREQLAVVALPLLCLVASEEVGASMFIAAFVAGLAVQVGFKDAGKHSSDFSEEWGQLINLGIFFYFGMVIARDWSLFDTRHILYAALSLTIVRLLPVAIALIGTRLNASTVLFMGWFGPRGLASIVLALVYLEQGRGITDHETIRLAVMMTVFMSIVAHGMSAMPGIRLYAARVERLGADSPEQEASSAGTAR